MSCLKWTSHYIFHPRPPLWCNIAMRNPFSQIQLMMVYIFIHQIEGAVLVVIVWWLDLKLPMQSVPIITNVVSSNPTQEIQHYVIKFVSDLRQVSAFLRVLWFPPPIKLGWPWYNWDIVESGIKHHKPNQPSNWFLIWFLFTLSIVRL